MNPGLVRFVEFGERFVQFAVDDFVGVEVELLEDCLVQQPPLVVATQAIQLVGFLKERDGCIEHGDPDVESRVDGFEAPANFFLLTLHCADASADLRRVHLAIGGEVDQLLFLGGQLHEMPLKLPAQQVGHVFVVFERRFEASSDQCRELWCEADLAVVLDDGVLDLFGVEVWKLARVIAFGATEKVEVRAAVTRDAGVHEPSLAFVLCAAGAEQ